MVSLPCTTAVIGTRLTATFVTQPPSVVARQNFDVIVEIQDQYSMYTCRNYRF